MDDVGRNPVGTKLAGNLQALLLREVGDTAHPRAKAPKGKHRRLAGDVGIFVQYILRLSEENEEIDHFIGHKQAVGTNIGSSEVAGDRRGGMHEDAITTIREEEGHGLVLAIGLWSLWIGH